MHTRAETPTTATKLTNPPPAASRLVERVTVQDQFFAEL
jgi:hypothetical protein